ncbi:carboxypeptidase-like regulatory domain-containing protein [Maribacter sp. HTCC2170]|uniref:TonB-dependent receptor n=1 Tax=Maribacter sp. (strain HTCC2170 / KCCM 42371) TaxID=313603 RepID=UPI00006AFD2F|nr:carboxypeptidase-like regulatory domain-containing protein [Maribacter sp. HTCC2170]EAR01531.1 putative TonB-dependent outer membrane receptor protein [Maribacter sp. HTCC2170]
MKNYIYIILLIGFQVAKAQDAPVKISINFENITLNDALNNLEELTGFQFYYVDTWIENQTVTKNYENVIIEDLLKDLFKDAVINFYITSENKIVLTRNVLIYDDLLKNFRANEEEGSFVTEVEPRPAPIFVMERKGTQNIETSRVGKEDPNNKTRKFLLSGYAQNTRTNEKIINLAIVVKGSDIGTMTDANGFYSLELPAGYNQLELSTLGIEKLVRNVIIFNDGNLNFELNESLEVLDEVIVEADAAKNVDRAITGVAQIEVKKIKTIPLVLGERDILKVATTLPGITTAGEGASGFNVRGGKTDQNLILLDNALIYNPAHFFGIFSALNPFTTGSVNIYKGSIPAEYGGRLSSVFDINTKDGNKEKFGGEASLGPVTSNLTLEIPLIKDKASLLVGARATYSKWILRSLKDASLKKSNASFYDGIVKYHHNINKKNDVRLTGYYSKDAFNITSDSLYGYSNGLISLRWDRRFNKKHSSSLLLSNSNYKFNIAFDDNSPNDFDLGYDIDETEVKLKFRYNHSAAHNFGYGLSSKLYKVNPGNYKSIIEDITIPKEKGLESAIFISDEFKISEKFLMNLGFRYSMFTALGEGMQRVYEEDVPKSENTLVEVRDYDKNEAIKTYGGPEFRLSTRYFLAPDLSVKASYGNTFQYIHTLSNNTTVSPTDTWKLSDLNIKPQKANQFSLGIYKNYDGNLFELSAETYYKKSTDIIDYKVGSELLLNEAIETEVFQGEGKSYGIEFLLKKNSGKLNGWLGYTYSRSLIKFDSDFRDEQINNGEYFPANFDKPHDISLVTNYKLSKRYSFSANFVYQTGRPITYPIGNYVYRGEEFVVYSDRNKFRIPDYYRLDISFNVEGNHKIKKFAHSFWNISVYNVLGRNNPYSVFFVTENRRVRAYKSSIFSIPVPTITYNFKF